MSERTRITMCSPSMIEVSELFRNLEELESEIELIEGFIKQTNSKDMITFFERYIEKLKFHHMLRVGRIERGQELERQRNVNKCTANK